MTSAIVTGLGSTQLEAHSIWLSPRNPVLAKDLASRLGNVSVASSNQEVLDRCETVVLAVRPQIAQDVLSELRFRPDHHVISIMSTVSLRTLSELVAPARKIARAVPLPSAAKKRSPTAIYPQDTVAVDLFAAVGTTFEVSNEREFDAVCAATATIASYFAFAQSITTWLEQHGIPQAEARNYLAQMFSGLAAAALSAPGLSFESLAADYATRGGINEQVLIHLTRRGVFDTIAEGLDAVMLRIAEAW